MWLPIDVNKIHTYDGQSKYEKVKKRGKSVAELQKLRKERNSGFMKGGLRRARRLTPKEFTKYSLENPNITCGCGSFNHFHLVHRETTVTYRNLVHGEGSTKENKENFIETVVMRSIEEARKRHMMEKPHIKFDPTKARVQYYLQCALTGRILPMCFQAFVQILGVSKDNVSKVVNMVKNGTLQQERLRRRNLKNERMKEDRPEYFAVCTYLESLSEDLASHSPDMRLTELPSGSKVQYYELFCKEWEDGLQKGLFYKSRNKDKLDQPPSKAYFYSVWRQEFSGLIVPKRINRFSKCDECVRAKLSLQQARVNNDHDEVQEWKTILYAHYKWVIVNRKKYHKHRRKACDNPHWYVRFYEKCKMIF